MILRHKNLVIFLVLIVMIVSAYLLSYPTGFADRNYEQSVAKEMSIAFKNFQNKQLKETGSYTIDFVSHQKYPFEVDGVTFFYKPEDLPRDLKTTATGSAQPFVHGTNYKVIMAIENRTGLTSYWSFTNEGQLTRVETAK